MEDLHNILGKVSRNEPYRVPEGYFDNLYLSILDKKQKDPGLVSRPVWKWAVATLVIVLVSGLFYFLPNRSLDLNSRGDYNLAELSDSQLMYAASDLELAEVETFLAGDAKWDGNEEIQIESEYLTEEDL